MHAAQYLHSGDDNDHQQTVENALIDDFDRAAAREATRRIPGDNPVPGPQQETSHRQGCRILDYACDLVQLKPQQLIEEYSRKAGQQFHWLPARDQSGKHENEHGTRNAQIERQHLRVAGKQYRTNQLLAEGKVRSSCR